MNKREIKDIMELIMMTMIVIFSIVIGITLFLEIFMGKTDNIIAALLSYEFTHVLMLWLGRFIATAVVLVVLRGLLKNNN